MKLRVAILAACVLVSSLATAGDRKDAVPALAHVRVLAFTSKTVAQCELDKPLLESYRRNGIEVISIDVDNDPLTADRFGVSGKPPVYIVERDGVEIRRTEKISVLHCILLGIFTFLVL